MTAELSASRLDHISLVAERPERPLDFAALLTLGPGAPSADALRAGAASAYRAFPRTSARLDGDRWTPVEPPIPRVEGHPPAAELHARVEAAVEAPIDPRYAAPLEQIIYQSKERTALLVRCHHAAADLTSLLWWVDHQLRTARGEAPAPEQARQRSPLKLRQHPHPRRKNHFAFWGPSRPLWRRREAPSRSRRFLSLDVDAARIRAKIGPRSARGFSYNDLLAASVLLAAREFQREHDAPASKLSLWFPVDVRAEPFSGFGNGASRVRVYDRAPPSASAIDLAFLVREELEAARAEGEWYVPADHPLFSLSDWVIRAYLTRPWVDMGSLLFSHAERLSAGGAPLLEGVTRVEGVATLDRRHPLGIGAFTLRGTTHLSFTWDPAQLDEVDAARMVELFAATLQRAEEELPPCAA